MADTKVSAVSILSSGKYINTFAYLRIGAQVRPAAPEMADAKVSAVSILVSRSNHSESFLEACTLCNIKRAMLPARSFASSALVPANRLSTV